MGSLASLVPVVACGVCTYGISEAILPATVSWSLLIPAWLVALAVLQRVSGVSLLGVPRVGWCITMVVVGLILSAAIAVGPLIAVAFAIQVVLGSVSSLVGKVRHAGSLASFFLILLAVLTAHAYYVASQRSPAERVLRLQNTPGWQIEMKEIEEREPESIGDYREILQDPSTNTRVLEHVLQRVVAIGEASTEVPFLVSVHSSCGEREPLCARAVHKALVELTGVSLVDTASSDEWREVWSRSEAETSDTTPPGR